MLEKEEIVSLVETIKKEIEKGRLDNNIELPAELLGMQAIHPGLPDNSASRNQMVSGNLGSSIRTKHPTIKKTTSGYEYVFSKTTWSSKAPGDMIVLSVHDHHYRNPFGSEKLPFERTVIYRLRDTGEVGALKLPLLRKFHEYFGTKMEPTDNYHKIERGAVFEKGDIFLKSPSVDEDGAWRYGMEMNALSSSDFDGIEDGVKFYRSACERMVYNTYGSIKFTIGQDIIPLNTYGNEREYKIVPDVGEYIGEDRVIAALRFMDPMLEAAAMTPRALSRDGIRHDSNSDKVFYLRPGERNAKVIGIDVQYQGNPTKPSTPFGVTEQLNKYLKAKTNMSIKAVKEMEEYERKGYPLTPACTNHMVKCIGDLSVLSKGDLKEHGLAHLANLLAPKLSGSSYLSEWEVTVYYEAEIVPGLGQKITGHSGNKSVITAIDEDENAYVDKDGRRAELVHDNLSIIKRTNSFALWEPGLNAMLSDVSKYALESIGFDRVLTDEQRRMIINQELTDDQYAILIGIYDEYMSCGLADQRLCFWEDMLINPESYKENIGRWLIPETQQNYVPNDGPYPKSYILYLMLEKYEDILTYDKITYLQNGVKKETVDRHLISSIYVLTLDKPAIGYQAVSSCPTNHYGLPSKLSGRDKQTDPVRKQATRADGEAENRNITGAYDDLGRTSPAANIKSYTDSALAHEAQIESMIKDPIKTPEVAVDRKKIPLGDSVGIKMASHILYTQGVQFERKEKKD